MTASDWIAFYAGVVATAALVLEIRRWFESGPKLRLSVIYPAETFPRANNNAYLYLTVSNGGDAPTTITHMVLFYYKDWRARLRGKPTTQGFIATPSLSGPEYNPPYLLDVGRTWSGAALENDELKRRIESGLVYVGVIASHSRHNFMTRVRPPKAVTKQKAA